MATQGAGRYAHVDAMRAAAVLLVVLSHAGLGSVIPGGSGVTIFFAISGFIITHLMVRELDRTSTFAVRGFYLRRIIKLGPPFLVLIAIPTAMWATSHDLSWPTFASQVFFYFNWWVVAGRAHGFQQGTGVLWSLSIEEQFYVVIAVVWVVGVRLRSARRLLGTTAVLLVVVATVVRLVLARHATNSDRIYYGTDTRMDSLAMGILTALLLDRWSRSGGELRSRLRRACGSSAALPLAGAVFVGSLAVREPFFRDTLRYTLQGLAACLALLAGFEQRSRINQAFGRLAGWRPIALVGLASYSIYLVNKSIVLVVRHELHPSTPVLAAVGTVACVIVGTGAWRLVEVPVQDARHRRDRDRARREALKRRQARRRR